MESQDNHLPAEHTFQETGPELLEENTSAAPAPAAILKRLRIGRPSLLPEMDETQLLAALESTEWQVRVAVVQKLEEWGERAPIERLVGVLKDEHEAVRAAAAHALGALGNPKAIPTLVNALQDTIWLVRAAVVQALGVLGEQAPVEPLMLALQDEDESVRAVAVRALGTMGERVPIERLLAALQDSAWQVREMAVLTLGARREHVPQAALTLALQDEDQSVRRAAHFVQETYPDRFAETMQQEEQKNDALSLEDERDSQEAVPSPGIQRYPLRGPSRVLRLALLACWTIFLGYLVGVAGTLVQLMHADLAQMSDRVFVQVLSTPFSALTNLPVLLRGACIALALLLFFGCLWATRDAWYEHRWVARQRVSREEDEMEARDHDQFRRVPIDPSLQNRAPRHLSRRAMLVGLTTVLIGGNTIAWSLLLNSRRRQGSSGLALGTVLYIYRRHRGSVWSVAWSPDSTRIASGSDDKTVQVWEAANGGHSLTFSGHASTALAVAWSPNGRRIASGNNDGTILVWDASTGRNVFTYENAGTPYGAPSDYAVTAVAWSPDGRRIASANFGSLNGSVQVWDAINGGHSFSDFYPLGGMLAVAWSPDGRRIASANRDETIQVWDASTGRNVFTYGAHSEDYTLTAAAWSPDGKYIALGIVNKTVQVWDASSGRHVYTYRGHTDTVTTVAWSPDSRRIASASYDKTVQVWDTVNGDHRFIYRGHTDAATAVAWSPDGKYIASGSEDKTVQVWDAG
ncbi:MAG: HEAT repeat domain-containing protein [Ktedonobacteraceae bacterium]